MAVPPQARSAVQSTSMNGWMINLTSYHRREHELMDLVSFHWDYHPSDGMYHEKDVLYNELNQVRKELSAADDGLNKLVFQAILQANTHNPHGPMDVVEIGTFESDSTKLVRTWNLTPHFQLRQSDRTPWRTRRRRWAGYMRSCCARRVSS